MSEVHPLAIKEIAREIALGNICFVHKYTKRITSIDKSLDDEDQIKAQDQQQADFEKSADAYLKIEKPSVEDQLEMMEYFLEELPDKSVSKQLSNALKRKNPIRNFIQTVESDMALKIHWSNFSHEEYQRWVSNFIIDAYNY